MTAPQTTIPAAKTARLIHASMLAGLCLFAIAAHFILRPKMASTGGLPTLVSRVLLGLSLAASALPLLLRTRIRRRSTDESADLFWTSAAAPAFVTWASLEAAGLLAILAYSGTGSVAAIAVAAVAIILFIVLAPASLERR